MRLQIQVIISLTGECVCVCVCVSVCVCVKERVLEFTHTIHMQRKREAWKKRQKKIHIIQTYKQMPSHTHTHTHTHPYSPLVTGEALGPPLTLDCHSD